MKGNGRELSNNNPRVERISIPSMICKDLGYCCTYAFFAIHKDNALVAARLGVTSRAVRYRRAETQQCTGSERCLSSRGKIPGESPKLPSASHPQPEPSTSG